MGLLCHPLLTFLNYIPVKLKKHPTFKLVKSVFPHIIYKFLSFQLIIHSPTLNFFPPPLACFAAVLNLHVCGISLSSLVPFLFFPICPVSLLCGFPCAAAASSPLSQGDLRGFSRVEGREGLRWPCWSCLLASAGAGSVPAALALPDRARAAALRRCFALKNCCERRARSKRGKIYKLLYRFSNGDQELF